MNELINKPLVSFSTNVCLSDFNFFEKLLKHKLRSLKYPFLEKIIFFDTTKPLGRFNKDTIDINKFFLLFDKLLDEKIIDKIILIPSNKDSYSKIFLKYYRRKDIGRRAKNKTPVFQFLYAWENCVGDYIFHTDSDMLFNYNSYLGWIEESIKIMKNNKEVIFTKCGSPPIAKNFFERFIKKSLKQKDEIKITKALSFSTRYFLMDKNKFNKLLPLEENIKGENLEKSIFYTLEKKGFETCNLSYSKYNWAIHPFSHDNNFIKYLDDIIWAVENNIYPYHRRKPAWNIYTKGKNINCWLKIIKEARNKII